MSREKLKIQVKITSQNKDRYLAIITIDLSAELIYNNCIAPSLLRKLSTGGFLYDQNNRKA